MEADRYVVVPSYLGYFINMQYAESPRRPDSQRRTYAHPNYHAIRNPFRDPNLHADSYLHLNAYPNRHADLHPKDTNSYCHAHHSSSLTDAGSQSNHCWTGCLEIDLH